MCQLFVLYQTVFSDTPEIRSLRIVLAEKKTLYQTVLSDSPESRSLKPRLDRGEARPLSFSKEVSSPAANPLSNNLSLSLSLSLSLALSTPHLIIEAVPR